MSTPRLYYDDSLQTTFSAKVIGHGMHQERPSVLLEQTAFYPESGGQMADHGQLAQQNVVDVQMDEQGNVHHILDGELPPLHSSVVGNVDRVRRKTHMALHTGQHILSRALFEAAGADTISARLGERECTIDLNRSKISDGDLQKAADLANQVVDEDFPIQARFPTAQELAAIPLRNPPKVSAEIRIVSIGDFDHTPCGGTHCAHTSQVGLIHLSQVEKTRGQIRVQFSAGIRARTRLIRHHQQLFQLAGNMSCGPFEIDSAVAKLRAEVKAGKENLGVTRSHLAKELFSQLKENFDEHQRIISRLPDGDPIFLRQISRNLVDCGFHVFLAGPQKDKLMVVIANPPLSSIHCGEILQKMADKTGGRGGGKNHFAQGHLPLDVDWPHLVRQTWEETQDFRGPG